MDSITEISLNAIAFYFLAGMSISSGLMILFSKNIVRSIFLLVVVFLGVAGIYMISNAEFVAVTQVLVYVGGILILLMFGIMLTNRIEGQALSVNHKRFLPAVLVGGLLFYILVTSITGDANFHQFNPKTEIPGDITSGFSNTQVIGINLMTNQILALEVTAVLLLVALVGAAFIVGNKLKPEE
ncbi:NADH-quinone oxidoreductase subunit J [Reichenbachiella sp. MALMAid0571]|uniref:NADH-quinone oxidoreductase subunit J family protein n=1 Tax=Reichenbachiella sp. MALMAid0571 TaxID=3143939 RepID=UPI0032E054BD